MKHASSQTLSLKINSRPPRLAYVIRNRADLLDGTRLLTHVWGGKADVLIPGPVTEEERSQLPAVLTEFDPDFILFGPGEVDSEMVGLLATLPCQKRQLRSQEANEYIEGLNPLLLGSGHVSDPFSVLHEQYPSGLQESRIRIIENGGPFEFFTRIAWGDPSDSNAAWLHNSFAAKILRAPQDLDELVRSALVGNARVTPLDVSITSVFPHLSYKLFDGFTDPIRGPLTQNEHTAFFFLDNGHSLSVCCAYWNARAAASSNKLLLPLDQFQNTIAQVLRAVRATRQVDNWIFVAELDDAEADSMRNAINDAVRGEGLGGQVAVISAGFKYSVPPFRALSGGSTSMTLAIGTEDDVRFASPRPKYAPTSALFGFDAEVTRSDGEKLSLPITVDNALLLSNSAERLSRRDSNEGGLGAWWLRPGLPVRPRRDGIAAVSKSEEESIWYLPTAERIIQQALRSRGVNLSTNRNTRYAVGVANKLGGLDAAMAFTRENGFSPLKPLLSEGAVQSGLGTQKIQHLLQTEYGFSQEAAKKVMASHFPRLLETGLVRRGCALTCRHCDLTEWYGISDLREFVECVGCAEAFQLTGLRLDFFYRINELAKRMIREGGLAVFSTASALDAMGAGQNLHLGGNLTRISERGHFAEVDILSLNRDAFAIAECKDYADLTNRQFLTEVAESLAKTVAVAPIIGAQIVVLGITSARWNSELFATVAETAIPAAETGLAVHLILNGQLHWLGEPTPTDQTQVSFSRLVLPRQTGAGLTVSGTLPTTFGGGRLLPVVAGEVIDAWEFNALTRPEFGGDSG